MSSKSKRHKSRKQRQPGPGTPSLRRTPAVEQRLPETGTCFPRQLPHIPLVHRSQPELIDGRLYMATARMRMDKEVMEFDLLASLHAIATGKLTGECADILAATAFLYVQQAPMPLPACDLTTSPAAMIDSFRRLINDGFVGCDEYGGYLSTGAAMGTAPAPR